MEKICVAVRVRPPTSEEEDSNSTYWKVEENRISLHKTHGSPISSLSFAFDHVFDQASANATVYQHLIKDIICAAVDGFNGTAFAYGQTSSGKTFTMNGTESDPGIIHRAVKDIFQNIHTTIAREFLIRVSYMEIYNEEINDLFAPENHKLQIHESLERGVFVAGLREEIVDNAEQVLKLIEFGEVNRHFGQTNMNIRSSRSHTIFRMVIESRVKDTSSGDNLNSDAVRVSVLNLVDLAGSERIAKTGAGGMRLKEGKHINKSLMVLGNVINKLSDGGKQRGHIPYRDSKLTRILQPALGGNAKTSIICTVAPEEVHVEETKGTLQFASRAKRITNCVQVNEILTDAALLKRQKLEIEELRKKLQGSHSEVLEQEIMKLRKDMLKYELEREKLAMELEEERKSHKEREQRIKEQQMKIDNLSSLVCYSDLDRNSSQSNSGEHCFPQRLSLDSLNQGRVSTRQSHVEECNDDDSISRGDAFRTPCFKAKPSALNSYVVKRSDYSRLPDSSPIPDNFDSVADEDMWLKLNKGLVTDLDSLRESPDKNYQSLMSKDISSNLQDYSIEYYREEVQNLRRQLQCAIQENNELVESNAKQLFLNNQLMAEISELQQEALSIREIPRRMCESVANCKDIYKDILSIIQGFAADGKSQNAKLLSSTSDVGIHLFSTLEAHFSRALDDDTTYIGENSVTQHECKVLAEKVNAAIVDLVSSTALDSRDSHLSSPQCIIKQEGSVLEEDWNASRKEELKTELDATRERCHILERECSHNNVLLKASEVRFCNLEKECSLLKEEQATFVQNLSTYAQNLVLVTTQKEKILEDLSRELQKRKELEEEVRRFGLAFAQRQRSFMTFHGELKDKMDNLRASSSHSVPISGADG